MERNSKFCDRCGTALQNAPINPPKPNQEPSASVETHFYQPTHQQNSSPQYFNNQVIPNQSPIYQYAPYQSPPVVQNPTKKYTFFGMLPCILFLLIMIMSIMAGEGTRIYNLGIEIGAAIMLISFCYYPVFCGMYYRHKNR